MGRYHLPIEKRMLPAGDLTARHQLRKDLQCHNFRWYLENVAPEMPFRFLKGSGEIANPISGLCLDKSDEMPKEEPDGTFKGPDYAVELYPCHAMGGSQYWWLTVEGVIMRDHICMDIRRSPQGEVKVLGGPCPGGAGPWVYDFNTGLLRHRGQPRDECLSTLPTHAGPRLVFRECDADDGRQQFVFSKYNERGLHFLELARPNTEYPFEIKT